MNLTILAHTHEKESYQVDGLKFYTEYALGTLTDKEKDFVAKKYNMSEIYGFENPVILLRRRVDIKESVITPWAWDILEDVDGFEYGVECFGDSAYWHNAISDHPSHKNALERAEKRSKLSKEIDYIDRCLSSLYKDYRGKFEQELKDKRIYSKALKNEAPQNIIDEIKTRIQDEYKQEKESLETKRDELKKQLNSI